MFLLANDLKFDLLNAEKQNVSVINIIIICIIKK